MGAGEGSFGPGSDHPGVHTPRLHGGERKYHYTRRRSGGWESLPRKRRYTDQPLRVGNDHHRGQHIGKTGTREPTENTLQPPVPSNLSEMGDHSLHRELLERARQDPATQERDLDEAMTGTPNKERQLQEDAQQVQELRAFQDYLQLLKTPSLCAVKRLARYATWLWIICWSIEQHSRVPLEGNQPH